MKHASLVVVLLLLASFPAQTGQTREPFTFDSGTAFLDKCHPDDRGALSIMCGFYVKGVVDGYGLAELVHGRPSYCKPDGVSALQAFRIVRKYIEDNPEEAHLPVMFLAPEAFKRAFPSKPGDRCQQAVGR